MTALAELTGVSKKYGRHAALTDVDFLLGEGEMVAVGGSGKSALLHILGVLERADRGSVRLFGTDAPHPMSAEATAYRRSRLGYLFKNSALIENVSVEQNLNVALAYVGRGLWRRALIEEALHDVDMATSDSAKVSSLSAGEKQRIAIARLLLKPCEIVVADEPTATLDPDERDAILGLLRGLNERGMAVVVATNDPVVEAACSRVVRLAAAPALA